MTPVLSRAQMRAFDAHAIGACRVPGLVLMENAGRGATDVLVAELLAGDARAARVAVVCGTGNNGGDGFVIARHLRVRGAWPVVHVLGDAQKVAGDARSNLDAWRGLGGEVAEWPAAPALGGLGQALASADVVVDALFGTGLDRPLGDFFAEAVRIVNAAPGSRFAVDLPSGLDADTGASLGATVEARVTATFAHPKLGLLTPNGAKLAGRVRVVDIGVPGSLAAQSTLALEPGCGVLLEDADVAGWLTRRAPGAHKTNGGHVAILGGSPGKVGAPKLAARGAMRAGAGLATIVTWPEAAATIEASVLEVMTARIDPARPTSLDEALQGKHVLAMGPGLGVSDAARAWVVRALAEWAGPVVVDADALTLFAGHPEAFRATRRGVLTPHPGEAARLLGRSPAQVEADRFGAVRELSTAAGAVVVLKGAHSIVASPDGRLAVSPVACAALATAGSGDVLTGVVAALSHALAPFEAACAGVLLHGRAGEAWSRAHGGADRGMLASEIADHLPSLRDAP